MRDSFLRFKFPPANSEDNLIARIRGNFRDAFNAGKWKMSSANGAPLHLPRFDSSPHASRSQGVSFLTHAAMISALTVIALHPLKETKNPENGATRVVPHLKFPPRFLLPNSGSTSDPGGGSGGGRVPIPTTAGNLVPLSSIQIVRPSLPPKEEMHMPVPPTILDPASAPILTPVDKIGLPWMKDDTDSPGPGDSNTIGSGPGHTMGDGPRDGPGGQGVSASPYRAGVTLAKCAYCPDPQYTDEAREAKLQGAVTLLVLVGADGRAAQVRIVKGIGLGLDERAAQTIRTWKFVPAYDGARHAVPMWVTVEAVFRLF
jgi:periplasmic protein TonB